jgi:hypothetical protein
MDTPQSRPRRPGSNGIRWLGWAAVGALLLGAALAPASEASTATGNNGTVKIHDGATETEPIVHNEPHVCTFHLHFFFADPFQAGAWEIQKWAPGDKGEVVLSGTYNTNPSGEDRQPEEGAYRLDPGHYKLFWDGDTGKHDKMKVFWVDCAAPTESPTGSGAGESETPTGTPTGSGAGESETPTGTPPGQTETPTGTPTGSGAGESEVPTGTPAGSFGGGGQGATVAPTQPSTDTIAPASGADSGGWRLLLLAFAGLLASLLILQPVRTPEATRRR